MEEQEQNMISQTIELEDYLTTDLRLVEVDKEDIQEHHMRSFNRPQRKDVPPHIHIKYDDKRTSKVGSANENYYYFILDGMKFWFKSVVERYSISYLEAICCVRSTYSNVSSETDMDTSIKVIVKYEDKVFMFVKDLIELGTEYEANREKLNLIIHNFSRFNTYSAKRKREREQEKRVKHQRDVLQKYTDKIWEHIPQTTGKCCICMSEDIECAKLECSEHHLICKKCITEMFINEEGIRIRCPICRKSLDFRTIGTTNGIDIPFPFGRGRGLRRRFEQEEEEEEEEEEWEEEDEEEEAI